jgi:hypothetical protein
MTAKSGGPRADPEGRQAAKVVSGPSIEAIWGVDPRPALRARSGKLGEGAGDPAIRTACSIEFRWRRWVVSGPSVEAIGEPIRVRRCAPENGRLGDTPEMPEPSSGVRCCFDLGVSHRAGRMI